MVRKGAAILDKSDTNRSLEKTGREDAMNDEDAEWPTAQIPEDRRSREEEEEVPRRARRTKDDNQGNIYINIYYQARETKQRAKYATFLPQGFIKQKM